MDQDKQPLVSIVIPTYNVEKYIGEALDSIFAQTYKNIEAIVVDDGSRDRTAEIVRTYGDRVQRYCFAENRGPVSVLNFGLGKASGEFILFFDADDILPTNAIEEFIGYFKEHPEADFSYGIPYIFFDDDDIENGLRKYQFTYPREATFLRFIQGNFLKLSQVMMRRKFLTEHEIVLDVALKYGGDWDLWLQLTRAGAKGFFIDKPMLYCCQRLSGLSGSSRGKLNAKKENFFIWEKYRKFLSEDERINIGFNDMIERNKIKLLFNAISSDDPGRFHDVHFVDYHSLQGKATFIFARILSFIVPPRLFDRLAAYYYRSKEKRKTFAENITDSL